MSYFIIIRGPAAVGKTTVAKALAASLGVKHIEFDKVMAECHLDVIENDGISTENFLKANSIVIPKAVKELEAGKGVIFDGCFYRKKQIENLVQSLPYKHFIFTLSAPMEECIKRNENRKNPLDQKEVETVYKLTKKVIVGDVIAVSEKDTNAIVEELRTALTLNG